MKIAIRILVILGLCSIVVYIIKLIGAEQLAIKETILISILLTMVSIITGWLISHGYFESTRERSIKEVKEYYQSNLKTYALKAAEKVNNLSNELNRLSVYLQEAIDNQDTDNIQHLILIYEEKMQSAIHMVNTLRSVNNTSLSDWQGVIGEELDQKEEERLEKAEELKDLIQQYESLLSTQQKNILKHQDASNDYLKAEMENIKSNLRLAMNSLSNTSLKIPKTPRGKKALIESSCLDCKNKLAYKQHAKKTSCKIVICPFCDAKFISRWDKEKGFYLEKSIIKREDITCPGCEQICEVAIETAPGSNKNIICSKCKSDIKISRGSDSLRVAKKDGTFVTKEIVSNELLDMVEKEMPQQPWPKGIHKIVAEKLNLSKGIISQAIQILIKKGIFKPQIDGKLFVEEKNDGGKQ